MTDTVFRVEATAAEAEHRAHLRRAAVASTVGTTIEWYDFLIYSTMTGLVFGARAFFSGSWLRAAG
jgi:hypothetical protein